MAPVVPLGVPAELTAGDTLKFQVTYATYPVSEGWTLSFVLAGAGVLRSVSTEITNDGGVTWIVTIPASRTATLTKGSYSWFAFMTGSGTYVGVRQQIDQGRITVLQDPALAAPGDLQAQCEKDLAAVQAVKSGRITDDIQSYVIGGRQVTAIPFTELLALERSLKLQVWKFQHPGQAFPVVRGRFSGVH